MAWSGQKVWATRLSAGYSNDSPSSLTLPAVDLGTWHSAALQFRHWLAIEDYWDGGRVEISTDNGASWHLLTPDGGYPWDFVDALGGPGFSGHSTDWQTVSFDLSSYLGMNNLLMRLHFVTDGGVTDLGWFVDDIEVVERQILAVPLHLQATDGVDQQVPLSWDPPAGVDPQQPASPLLGYNVFRATQPDLSNATQVNAAPVGQESFVDATVSNGTRYHYAVSAVYAEGESPRSVSASALPYRATVVASVQQLVIEAPVGAGVDTSVTFSNSGTGFLKLNAWVGDPGQSADDVRISWVLDPSPDMAAGASRPPAEKAGAVPRRDSPRTHAATLVPTYTDVFEDPLDAVGTADLHRFGVAQENGILYFRVTGYSAWQNILTQWTLIIAIDSDGDRGTGDAAGADHYVLVGAFPMQSIGVPAFISNPQQEILGIASHVVVPMNADSLEVGFDRTLLGTTASRVYLSAMSLSADLSLTFDVLPNPASASDWLTLGTQSLSIEAGTPQPLPLSLAADQPPAAYDAHIFLDTNDPDAPTVELPLQFRSGVTPVTVFDLSAVQQRDAVLLSWRTSRESGVQGYRVFRSLDGGAFVGLAPDVPLDPQGRYSFRDVPQTPGTCAYRIGEVSASGEVTLHGLVTLDVVALIPERAFLDPNAPNPFNPSTRLSFGVDRRGPVSLRIFDARGRLVRTLVQEALLDAGYHQRLWDGRDERGRRVASGVYHARLVVNGRALTQRLTLLK
jgi:hypothetical protein